MAPPPAFLQLENISCARGGRQLFAPVSVQLAPGETLLLKGANGSGKTTFLRHLAGFIPSNLPLLPASLYLGHNNALHRAMTVGEHLAFWRGFADAGGLSDTHILETLGLSICAQKRIATLSQGQKRRLSLARLLLHNAPLWLLDEPQAALDSAGAGMLLKLLERHAKNGGMAVIASHDLDIPGTKILMLAGGG